jgi:hypothetical protein
VAARRQRQRGRRASRDVERGLLACRKDLRIGEAILDLPPVADRLDEADRSQRRKVLRCRSLTQADLPGDLVDLGRLNAEHVQDSQPMRACQRTQHRRLQLVDVVGGVLTLHRARVLRVPTSGFDRAVTLYSRIANICATHL